MDREAFDCLMSHNWPGNIRELENLIERLTIIKSTGIISVNDLPKQYSRNKAVDAQAVAINFPEGGVDFNSMVDEFENQIILQALAKTGWNKNQAALLLRLNRTTLIEKIKKKGLVRPEPAQTPEQRFLDI